MTPDQLRAFLEHHKLTSERFAETIGVTRPAVDHWLSGRRRIPRIVVKICKVLDQYPQLTAWVGAL